MKKCWEIKNCPAARFESSCPAFKSKMYCWEVEGTICAVNHGNDICEKCEVFVQKRLALKIPQDYDNVATS